MKLTRLILPLIMAALLLPPAAYAFELPFSGRNGTVVAGGSVQILFTPGDDAAGHIIQVIEGARKQVLVQAFSFTSDEIAGALIDARRRGIDVQVIADAEQIKRMKRGQVPKIAAGGVPVYIDRSHASAHNKVMIVDAAGANPVVITGSFNFTNAAQHKNAENLLIFRNNPELISAYYKNWKTHREHAEGFSR